MSNTNYLTGLACHRLLWHAVHARNLPALVPDADAQFRLEQGAKVRERALGGAAPAVFDATFTAGGATVRVDVLRRVGDGFDLLHVTQASSVKDADLIDVAMQLWVLRAAGLTVPRAFLMCLNKRARFPALDDLFVVEDVTERAEPLVTTIPPELAAQQAVLAASEPPPARLVRACRKPRDCALVTACWPAMPANHVTTLYDVRWKHVERFLADGRETIEQLDELDTADAVARRQIRAVKAGRRIVENGLGVALDALKPPLAWLHFESTARAIPPWPKVAPHEPVPVRLAVQLTGVEGDPVYAWRAEPGADPRRGIAEALVQACSRARTVVVYDAKFEKECIKHLAQAVPDLADVLGEIHMRVVDLLPILRDHVYDPAFGGDFSLEKVLPVLVSNLSHEGLEITHTLAMQRLAGALRDMANETARAA